MTSEKAWFAEGEVAVRLFVKREPSGSVEHDPEPEVEASIDRAFEEARRKRDERNEATRARLVAVCVSMTETMPAWVLAQILAAAPPGATIAGIDTRWMAGELAVVLRHESFPRVPEGVEVPRVVATVFGDDQRVQVEWPAAGRAAPPHDVHARGWCVECGALVPASGRCATSDCPRSW